jgi:hypothetical protein
VLGFALASGVQACGDSTGDGTASSASTTGAAGATGCEETCQSCGEGWELVDCEQRCICERPDDTAQQLKEAYLEVAACEVDAPCPTSWFQADPGLAYWQNGECLLAALRDRTVGRYKYVATYSDIGSSQNELLLLVSADGTVLLSGANEETGSVVHRSYRPTERCTLKGYQYFEDCLAAGTEISPTTSGGAGAGSGPAMTCEHPGGWYSDCEAAEPMCPNE